MTLIQNISDIYRVLTSTARGIINFKKERTFYGDNREFDDIKKDLEDGDINLGDEIKVVGKFSEFLPFINLEFYPRRFTEPHLKFPYTTRVDSINNLFCGALYAYEETNASSENIIPLFYNKDSKMSNYTTGMDLELKCKIVPIYDEYSKIINSIDSFSFTRTDGTKDNFGLKVIDVDIFGASDLFYITNWLIGNIKCDFIKPPKIAERSCAKCAYFSSYIALDPFKLPMRGACSIRDEDMDKRLQKETRQFYKIREKGSPYYRFTDEFYEFEVVHPKVNIFDKEQFEYSKNLLYDSLSEENISKLLSMLGPKNLDITVDFQSDQRAPIKKQTFVPTKDLIKRLPSWKCIGYEPKKR